MEIIGKYKWELIGATVGGLVGLLYWNFVGCESGACTIKSDPWWSSIYGLLMGYFIGGLIKDFFFKKVKKES